MLNQLPSPPLLRSLCFLLFNLLCSFPLSAAPPKSDADSPREPLPEKLIPAKLRSEEEQDRVTAAAWFTQGRVLQQQEDYARALRCYQRAWRWDSRGEAALQEI